MKASRLFLRRFTSGRSTTIPRNEDHAASRVLLASLPPLKRILCLCPVPVPNDQKDGSPNNSNEYERLSIGMAISDPYLSYAIPIEPSTTDAFSKDRISYHSPLSIPKESGTTSTLGKKRARPIIWEGLPKTSEEFLDQVGYRDVGALVFSLPLKRRSMVLSTGSDCEDTKMKAIRKSINCMVQNLRNGIEDVECHRQNQRECRSFLDLQCFVEDQLTALNEARAMAAEEPEMWEEISLGEEPISPDMQAATALNAFLWKHTGGWRNTFA